MDCVMSNPCMLTYMNTLPHQTKYTHIQICRNFFLSVNEIHAHIPIHSHTHVTPIGKTVLIMCAVRFFSFSLSLLDNPARINFTYVFADSQILAAHPFFLFFRKEKEDEPNVNMCGCSICQPRVCTCMRTWIACWMCQIVPNRSIIE